MSFNPPPIYLNFPFLVLNIVFNSRSAVAQNPFFWLNRHLIEIINDTSSLRKQSHMTALTSDSFEWFRSVNLWMKNHKSDQLIQLKATELLENLLFYSPTLFQLRAVFFNEMKSLTNVEWLVIFRDLSRIPIREKSFMIKSPTKFLNMRSIINFFFSFAISPWWPPLCVWVENIAIII